MTGQGLNIGGVSAGDVVLLVGATLRATRLVVADDVPGQWWVKDPIDRAMERYEAAHPDGPEAWWWKYRSGIDCPHCVSVHLSYLVLGSYLAARAIGPGALSVWRFGAGVLSLSSLVGHISAHFDHDPEEEENGDA